MKQYLIHNDLSNPNRKRIDIFDSTITLSNIEELSNYNIIIEESFQDGNVTKYYVILKELDKHDIKLNNLLNVLSNNDIDVCSVDGFDTHHQVVIKGCDYDIYIDVMNEECDDFEGFDLYTLNTNIDWKSKEENDIYFNNLDMFKNKCNRKNVKSVLKYVEKYI